MLTREEAPLDTLEVVTIEHPLSTGHRLDLLDAGPTIADLIAVAGLPPWLHARVYVNGDLVYPAFYHVVRPRRGAHVLIRAVPRGGGGNGQSKNIGMIIAGILLIVVGVVLAVGSYGVLTTAAPYVISTGVSLLLGGILNLLIPVPSAPRRPLSGLGALDSESPTLSIAGQRNDARPFGIVPRVLGRHRIYPPYAALPFTELVGSQEWLRLLFSIGLGETTTEDLRIGETPIENFIGDPADPDVQLEVRTGAPGEPPITLYTNDVTQDALSIALTFNVSQVRTSRANASELSIDIAYPTGLVFFEANGTKVPLTVTHTIDYRLLGQAAFVRTPRYTLTTTDARQALVRDGYRWRPQRPAGPFGAAFWAAAGLGAVTLSRLNDGVLDVAAFDADAAAAGSWLRLSPPAPAEFGRVVVTSAGGAANATWAVQYSDDLVTWTTVVPALSTGAASEESAEWETVGFHAHWRLLKTNGPTAGPDYYEVEFWQTTAGQWDVRLTRTTVDPPSENHLTASAWTALRSIALRPPLALPPEMPHAVIAMRIRATDRLNGVVDNFNCIATSRHLDYATYASSVLADAPLGYWRLGEVDGAPTAFDASGHARAGAYRGDADHQAAGLVVGDDDAAMQSVGSGSWVDSFVGLSAIDLGGISFTLEVIVEASTIDAGISLILFKAIGDPFEPGALGVGVRRNGDTIQAVRNAGGGAPTIVTSGVIAANTPYLVQVTYDIASGLLSLSLNYDAIIASAVVGTTPYFDSYGLVIGRRPT